MWTEISEATVNKLEGLQNLFLKVILDSPSTTPNCAGVWDTAMTRMRFRIMKRKLRFINFIKKCDDSFLAKQIYQEQLKHNWPGLTQEAREMCVFLDLPDITKVAVSNQEIENKVRDKNKSVLIAEMTNLSKMKDLIDEEFEIKDEANDYELTLEGFSSHYNWRVLVSFFNKLILIFFEK